MIVKIPFSEIERVSIYLNRSKKSVSAIKSETGADCILNGGMWNADSSACPLLKAGGTWVLPKPWSSYGYVWDSGPDIMLKRRAENAEWFYNREPNISFLKQTELGLRNLLGINNK